MARPSGLMQERRTEEEAEEADDGVPGVLGVATPPKGAGLGVVVASPPPPAMGDANVLPPPDMGEANKRGMV